MTAYFKLIFFACICNSISHSLGNSGHGFLRKNYSQHIARTSPAIDFSHDIVSASRQLWPPFDPPPPHEPHRPHVEPPEENPGNLPGSNDGSRQPIVPGQPIGPADPTIQPPQAGDEQIPVATPAHRENRNNTLGYLENMSVTLILISMSLTASVSLFCCMYCVVKTWPGIFNRAERPINPSLFPTEEEQQVFARSLAGGFYDSIEMTDLTVRPVSDEQDNIHTWNLRRNRF